jgi:tetratricopeptide (TPR) repeat protein
LTIGFQLLVIAALGVPDGQMTPLDQALLAKALVAYEGGDSQQAETALRGLAVRHPRSFEITETLGLIYASRGDLDPALPLMETACRANGLSPQAAANLGALYLRLNRIPEAVASLTRAVALDPKNSQTQSAYGQALMLAKRPQEGAKALAAAATGDPANADILYNWALAQFDSGDANRAAEILSQILPESRSSQVESLWGDVQEKLGHFDAALASFQMAAKADPSETNLNNLGLELLRHWSFDAAAQVYKYSCSKYPSSTRLQFGLGVAQYGNNESRQSTLTFSRLLASNPDDAGYAKLLGWSCVAIKGESRAGCDQLETYAARHRENTAAGTAAASVILEQQDSAKFELARQLLEHAISKEPASPDAYYRMGVLDQEQGRWAGSLPMLKRAAALRPNFSKVHFRLALAYGHLGRKEEARREALLQRSDRGEEEARLAQIKTFVLTLAEAQP